MTHPETAAAAPAAAPAKREGDRIFASPRARNLAEKAGADLDVYEMYADYSEAVSKIADHRILAINRGEKEEFLKVNVQVDSDIILNYLFGEVITNAKSPAREYIQSAVVDSYDRLIAPSVERDIRASIFDDASESAIKLFADNLKHLLMQSPLKGKTVLGFDPGFINGCKTAVVDKTGKVLDTNVVYCTPGPKTNIALSKKIIKEQDLQVISLGL